jgi:two-component system cell cycle sensor histidine kinase/response regulator CckA
MTRSVLIVEDNAIIREGLSLILRRNGYGVTAEPNGHAALERLASGPRPDVILLDMLMPVLDGWQLLKLLKSGRYADIPVIIATGTILTSEWAAMEGCQGFLKKPFEEHELLEALRSVLSSAVLT